MTKKSLIQSPEAIEKMRVAGKLASDVLVMLDDTFLVVHTASRSRQRASSLEPVCQHANGNAGSGLAAAQT